MLTKSNTTFKELLQIPLDRPPNAGAYWKGIKHGDLLLSLVSRLNSSGYKTGSSTDAFRAWVSGDKGDVSFSMRLHSDSANIGYGVWPVLGIEASNARRKVLRAFAGGVDRVTESPLIISDFVGSRYTQAFELGAEVENIVDWWETVITSAVPETVRRFRAAELSPKEAEAIMFASGRKGIIPWAHLGNADKLWQKREDKTAWGMVEVFYRVGYSQPLHAQLDSRLSLYKLLSSTIGSVKAA